MHRREGNPLRRNTEPAPERRSPTSPSRSKNKIEGLALGRSDVGVPKVYHEDRTGSFLRGAWRGKEKGGWSREWARRCFPGWLHLGHLSCPQGRGRPAKRPLSLWHSAAFSWRASDLPPWYAVCRKESSKIRQRPSAQHWGSPPTTSSQLLGVFKPAGGGGGRREERQAQHQPSPRASTIPAPTNRVTQRLAFSRAFILPAGHKGEEHALPTHSQLHLSHLPPNGEESTGSPDNPG